MIGIRADANSIIGSGHIMRCMTIASEIVNCGEEVVFFVSDYNCDVLLRDKGFQVVCLESNWNNLDEVENVLIRTIKENSIKCVLVDSYYITDKYVDELSKLCKVAYIDDINRSIPNVSLLINYNIYANKDCYEFTDDEVPQFALSTQYAPLRAEFKGLTAQIINETVKNVIVIAGGADPQNITAKLLAFLAPKYRKIFFHVIIGALNDNKDEICNINFDNIKTYYDVKNMQDIMQLCDIAISSSGSVLYELCACGIPTIGYVMADNQRDAIAEFSRQGVIIDAGSVEDESFLDSVSANLSELRCDSKRRMIVSRKMQDLVDGLGAKRLAKKICNI